MVGGALVGISATSTAADVAAGVDSLLTPHALHKPSGTIGKKALKKSRVRRCTYRNPLARPCRGTQNLGLLRKVFQCKCSETARLHLRRERATTERIQQLMRRLRVESPLASLNAGC